MEYICDCGEHCHEAKESLIAERDSLKEIIVKLNKALDESMKHSDMLKEQLRLCNADQLQAEAEVESFKSESWVSAGAYAELVKEIERLKGELELGRGKGILYGEGELGYLCNEAEKDRNAWKAWALKAREALENMLKVNGHTKNVPCHLCGNAWEVLSAFPSEQSEDGDKGGRE